MQGYNKDPLLPLQHSFHCVSCFLLINDPGSFNIQHSNHLGQLLFLPKISQLRSLSLFTRTMDCEVQPSSIICLNKRVSFKVIYFTCLKYPNGTFIHSNPHFSKLSRIRIGFGLTCDFVFRLHFNS